jgi:hypothetical protein
MLFKQYNLLPMIFLLLETQMKCSPLKQKLKIKYLKPHLLKAIIKIQFFLSQLKEHNYQNKKIVFILMHLSLQLLDLNYNMNKVIFI